MWVHTIYLLTLAGFLSAEWVPVPVIDRRTDTNRPASQPQDAVQAEQKAAPSPRPPLGEDEVHDDGDMALHDLKEAHLELLRQSKEPFSGKLHFLQQLHDRLLRRVAALIPQTVRSFVSTGNDEETEGRGHKGIGFPSNEGTLLSLCFLVFAVFLVKVVMQLIYAVQNNQVNTTGAAGVRVAQMPDGMLPGTMMNMMPAMMPGMMAAGGATPAAAGARTRRSAPAGHSHPGMEQAAREVIEAIHRAQARFAWDTSSP